MEKRRRIELEIRQDELRRTNPAWEQIKEDLIDYDAIDAKREERIEAERERIREYR